MIARLYFQDGTSLFWTGARGQTDSLHVRHHVTLHCVFVHSCLLVWSSAYVIGHRDVMVGCISPKLIPFQVFCHSQLLFFPLLRHPQRSAPLHPKHTSRTQMNGRCAVFCSNAWLWLNEACCNGKAPKGITMRKTMFYFFCIQHFRFKRLVFFSFFFFNWAHFCKLK